MASDSSQYNVGSLENARNYFSAEYNVIPIPPPGESVNVWEEETKEYTKKVADGKSAEGYGSWKHLINNRQSKEDFESRFKDKPNCNIAIISGKVSQAFSIDIDGEEGRKYFYDKIGESDDEEIKNAIRNTLKIKTGGGNSQILLGCNPNEFDTEEDIPNILLWIGDDEHGEGRD